MHASLAVFSVSGRWVMKFFGTHAFSWRNSRLGGGGGGISSEDAARAIQNGRQTSTISLGNLGCQAGRLVNSEPRSFVMES